MALQRVWKVLSYRTWSKICLNVEVRHVQICCACTQLHPHQSTPPPPHLLPDHVCLRRDNPRPARVTTIQDYAKSESTGSWILIIAICNKLGVGLTSLFASHSAITFEEFSALKHFLHASSCIRSKILYIWILLLVELKMLISKKKKKKKITTIDGRPFFFSCSWVFFWGRCKAVRILPPCCKWATLLFLLPPT